MGRGIFSLVIATAFFALTTPILTSGHFLRPMKNIIWPGELSGATPPASGGVPLFLLHILKHKLGYPKLQRITTTPATTSQCICVPYYLCNSNNTIITDGIGVIDIRIRRCTGDLEVCCYMPNVTSTPQPIPTAIPTAPTSMPTMPPTMLPTVAPTMPPTMQTMATMPATMPTMPTMATMPATMPTMPTMATMPATMPTMPTMATMPATMPTMQTMPATMATMPTMQTMPTMPATMPTVPTMQTMPATMPTMPTMQTMPATMPTMPTMQTMPATMPTMPTMPATMQPTMPPTMPPTMASTLSPIMTPTMPATMAPVTVFPTSSPNLNCVCVEPYQCDASGVIIISGAGVIDPRQQQGLCPIATQVCCRIPVTSVVFPTSMAQVTSVTPVTPITPNQMCVCVKIWQCDSMGFVIVSGAGNIDPRFPIGRQAQLGGTCQAADEICCRLPSNGQDSAAGTPSNNPQPSPSGTLGPIRNPGTDRACICVNTLQCSAGFVVSQDGAGIIDPRFGICPMPQDVCCRLQGILVAGTPSNGRQTLAIIGATTPTSDSSDVTFQMNVRPICLPQQGMVLTPGVRCFATGWGRNSFGVEGQYQAVLRQVDLPIVERAECQTRLRSTRLGQYFQLHGSFMCAGGELSKDTCRGDGGGPLVCPTSTGRYVQVGIVSWGIGCGASSTPAVYASVSQHRQWIDQQLANYGVLSNN